jgi:ADP-ribosylglycohydrolase
MDRRSRYRGALLGLAAGDALGTTVEFTTPGEFKPLTDIVGGGPFQMKPGEWTDDTSMALCLAESLFARNGFDPVHQLETYVRWYREGHRSVKGRCFDIGTTTARSLQRFERTREPYCGPTSPDLAGNGSLMRGWPRSRWRLPAARPRPSHGPGTVRGRHTRPRCAWTPAATSEG